MYGKTKMNKEIYCYWIIKMKEKTWLEVRRLAQSRIWLRCFVGILCYSFKRMSIEIQISRSLSEVLGKIIYTAYTIILWNNCSWRARYCLLTANAMLTSENWGEWLMITQSIQKKFPLLCTAAKVQPLGDRSHYIRCFNQFRNVTMELYQITNKGKWVKTSHLNSIERCIYLGPYFWGVFFHQSE